MDFEAWSEVPEILRRALAKAWSDGYLAGVEDSADGFGETTPNPHDEEVAR